MSTPAAARRIARALGRRGGEVSFAGRKDAVAVTRQRMSVEHVEPEALLGLEVEGLRLSDPRRQRRKLRPGELRGNRFTLTLRGVAAEALPRMRRGLELLEREGMPNLYGVSGSARTARGWRRPGGWSSARRSATWRTREAAAPTGWGRPGAPATDRGGDRWRASARGGALPGPPT